jgi:hypothetical protein
MKKTMILMAVMMMAMTANAQKLYDMGKYFQPSDEPVELNEAATVKDGLVFVGDTRPADKIQNGKYRGMRVQKSRRYFTVDGKPTEMTAALSFRRAPQGATKDHVIDPTLEPRSCMLQLKPLSDGQLTFYALTNKPEGNNIYVAVKNGESFKPLSTVKFTKFNDNTGRSKKTPAAAQAVDYKYTEGDQLWIYSDGSVNLQALGFTGQIDETFEGK